MQGFLVKVFDKSTGRILNEPCVASIEAIRQLAYGFKKLEMDCKPERVRRAISRFKENELDLSEEIPGEDLVKFDEVCKVLWGTLFQKDFLVVDSLPKHGPGATADGRVGNNKFVFRRWHDRLEPYFPLLGNAFSSENAYQEREFEDVAIVQREQEQPVKVTPVPKTLKGPRIIAIEPCCMQYAQQGLAKIIITSLQRSALCGGHVNFRDQTVNRRLALVSSADKSLSTIDLSDASDRVPLSLAIRMFDSVPDLQGAILACRSESALLPDGSVLDLKKFASMGSALCFPIEAMYFYTLCVASLLEQHDLPVTYWNIHRVSRSVYVYGDDILVPSALTPGVIDYLQKYYCKVGADKSYWTGKFRESCGMDAFNGVQVTPLYVKRSVPNGTRNAKAFLSTVALANNLYKRGYWQAAAYLVDRCEKHYGKLPIVGPRCSGVGLVSFQPQVSIERWNKRYQTPEVRAWHGSSVYRTDELSGQGALLKCLLSLEGPPALKRDDKHLSRSARYGTVALKRRWTRPY
jgi:hypothetical protein